MDNTVLRKRLSTFMSSKGVLRGVSDEVIMEVLRAWESWPGTSADFYRDIGISKQQLAILIKKGKELIKRGVITESEFKEIPIKGSLVMGLDGGAVGSGDGGGGSLIMMRWGKGKVIRFSNVDQLVEFLRKVA